MRLAGFFSDPGVGSLRMQQLHLYLLHIPAPVTSSSSSPRPLVPPSLGSGRTAPAAITPDEEGKATFSTACGRFGSTERKLRLLPV
jgi:hypothetical protein